MKLLKPTPKVVSSKLLYSAFIDDLATIDCFLELQSIKFPL